jgi:hypothetical protein
MYYLSPTTKLLVRCCGNVSCFNAWFKWAKDNIKMLVIYGNPKMNIYYVAAKETMQAGLLTRIMAYAGNANFSRANLALRA